MTIRYRTSSELGLLVVACIGCNAITNLDRYEFRERDVTHCGLHQDEDCRIALPVEGGSFFRAFGPGVMPPTHPARVSSFRLDRFEVTVGRFRAFVDDVVAGRFFPQPGDGKHRIPNATGDGYLSLNSNREKGWRATDTIPTTLAAWRQDLAPPQTSSKSCDPHTFTNEAGDNENRPINCVSWAEAYAFCIWAGGFLPTDAEWEYAAAGGSKQLLFPWGAAPPDARLAVFGCLDEAGNRHPCSGTDALFVRNIARVGSLSVRGPFGHLDLAGNLREWTADRGADGEKPPAECDDCVADETSSASTNHILHGGSFDSGAVDLENPSRTSLSDGRPNTTFRCAYPF